MSDPQATSLQLYRRLLSYAFKHKIFFAISVFGFALFSASQSALIKSIELFFNHLEGKETDWLKYFPEFISESMYVVPIFIVVLGLSRSLGNYLGNFYISLVGMNVVNSLRKEVFNNIIYLPQSTFDKSNSGDYVSLILYNIDQVKASVTRAVKTLFEDGLMLVGLLIILFSTHWKLTMVFAVAAPLLSSIVYLASSYFRRVSRRIQKTVGKVSHTTNEAVQGIQIVKSYTAEAKESDRFADAADTNLRYSIKFERVRALQTPVMHFVITVALAVILFLIILFWPQNDSASAVVYVMAAFGLGKPVKQLSMINSIIQRGLAASESIFEIIDADKEPDHGQVELVDVKGQIRIENLTFSYNNEQAVLNDINLDIASGQTIALVGHSGSGKTTLASLLQRFYQVAPGTIYIDGHDINAITLRSLRSQISLVSQSPIIFDTSVIGNVCYGSSDYDPQRLQQALKDANALEFVNELENGIETELGENGSLLSGGQRQRIAIARALYKDAPILVLDEATSALDNESEQYIQIALEKLMQGRTTIVIAHRLSTIQNADSIVVMDQGRVIEMGKHHELLELDGAYARLHYTQPTSD
jgi:subfamily B ATP-binding cassette protein MsbA